VSQIFYVPGVVYSGETNEQAFARWEAIEAHNRKAREEDWRNSLPMPAVRDWAAQRGILPPPPNPKEAGK
jgi:hypothetical protein